MGFCGGGDPSAELRKQEQEREQRMQEAIAAINAVFGSDVDTSWLDSLEKPAAPRVPESPADFGIQETIYARGAYPQLQKDYEAKLKQYQDTVAKAQGLPEEAKKNRLARENLYRSTEQNILNYFRDQLDKQRQEEEARMRVLLAQRGLTGSSIGTGIKRKFLDEYNQRLNELTGRAEAATNDLRTADEQARLDLISRIRAGMDRESALAGARNTLQQNAQRALSTAMATNLGDLFDTLDKMYGKVQEDRARKRGVKDAQNLVAPGMSGYGTPSRGRIYSGG